MQRAARELAGVASVLAAAAADADHPLHREAGGDIVRVVVGDLDRFEVREQRRSGIPGHVRRAVDDAVAAQRGDRDVQAVVDAELFQKRRKILDDLLESLLVVVDEVHLVDRDDDVRDPQQRADEGVAFGLLDRAPARVEQHDGQVGG